eukprot:scaffold81484_cov31-Tisochrysis_lutea.AAC.7
MVIDAGTLCGCVAPTSTRTPVGTSVGDEFVTQIVNPPPPCAEPLKCSSEAAERHALSLSDSAVAIPLPVFPVPIVASRMADCAASAGNDASKASVISAAEVIHAPRSNASTGKERRCECGTIRHGVADEKAGAGAEALAAGARPWFTAGSACAAADGVLAETVEDIPPLDDGSAGGVGCIGKPSDTSVAVVFRRSANTRPSE